MKLLQLSVLFALLPLLAAADSLREFQLRGTVRAILSADELVIAHEDIPNFMPAMSMSFKLAQPAPDQLKVNDQIEAVLVVNGSTLTLKDLVVVGQVSTSAHPSLLQKSTTRLDQGDSLPDFALINQDGVTQAIVSDNHYTLLTFIFTRCPVPDFCPLMSSRFASIQEAIQSKKILQPLHLLSITIDPEFDTPEQLAAYANALGADHSIWNFACATPDETDRIVRAFRVFRERNGALLDHTLCTALIDPKGSIIQIWRGNFWSVDDVINQVNQTAKSK